MNEHPYKLLPNKAFWKRSVAGLTCESVDPVGSFELRITSETKVATAGSCFAQHIARHLQKTGFNYYVVETGHPILPAEVRQQHNYGVFSARYGNIYTAKQLLQLFLRAYDRFSPAEDIWIERDGTVLDPFRPTIQPGGFVSEGEMRADRNQHLDAVRRMFETLDVFIFTLGLTECWLSSRDKAAFPTCPGVQGGRFDPERYAFCNQSVEEVVSDMSEFTESLKAVNPRAQIMLTVSPVPLMATAEPGDHVLSATTYSKAVLRVAAEILRKRYSEVHYFPSYEIISGAFNRARYFADDLRNVTEDGVTHVMGLFLHHATGGTVPRAITTTQPVAIEDQFADRGKALVEVECDEVALDR